MTSSGSTSPPPGGFPATAFFSKTFDEAQSLIVETLDYARIARQEPRDSPVATLSRGLESMRLSTRLTQISAWLMFQRAVHSGEMPPEEMARPSNRLGGHDICYDRRGEDSPHLSPKLRDLLRRSRKLYQRVARLDEMIARDIGQAPERPVGE